MPVLPSRKSTREDKVASLFSVLLQVSPRWLFYCGWSAILPNKAFLFGVYKFFACRGDYHGEGMQAACAFSSCCCYYRSVVGAFIIARKWGSHLPGWLAKRKGTNLPRRMWQQGISSHPCLRTRQYYVRWISSGLRLWKFNCLPYSGAFPFIPKAHYSRSQYTLNLLLILSALPIYVSLLNDTSESFLIISQVLE